MFILLHLIAANVPSICVVRINKTKLNNMETLLEKLKLAFAHQAIVEGLPIKAEHTNRLSEIALRLCKEHSANTPVSGALPVSELIKDLGNKRRKVTIWHDGGEWIISLEPDAMKNCKTLVEWLTGNDR